MRLHSIEPLHEGGNIFKNTSGESVTGRISRADIEPTIKWLETITKLPLVDNTLGSVGKKESSGDLDIAVDQNAVSKDELVARLTQWVKAQGEDPKNWIKKSGISVHFLTPIRGDKTLGYVQSDFMFGDDIEHMKFGLYSAGDASKFSGADRNLLMSSVAKSLPGDYKYSWQKGLIERSTGNTITRDPDQIAKILLGSMKYTRKDLDSVESIIAAIKNPTDKIAGPNRYELLTVLADRLTSTEGKKAAEIRADSEEANRLHKILGASTELKKLHESDEDEDEQEHLAAVNLNGEAIRFIENPSEQVQLAAVNQNGFAIRYIENPSEQVQLAAVNKDGYAIGYIRNPSEQVKLAAVNQNGFAIQYIKNPSEQVLLAAVKQDGSSIYYIKNPSERLQLAAVKKDGWAIQYIKNPSEPVQLAAVKNNGWAFQLIKNPSIYMLNKCKHEIIKVMLISLKDSDFEFTSELIQKAAKTNWPELAIIKRSLDHEKNRITESVEDEQAQIAAVKQNGLAIRFIKNPSEQVQLAAVKQNGNAIRFIKNPSEQLQITAVKQSGWAIRYIKNPSEQLQIAAVKQNGRAIDYIKNPSIYMLNKCKHEIIKVMLISLKDSDFEFTSELIQKAAKTNWPELAIIKRSLDHEKNRITESVEDEQAQIAAVKRDGKAIRFINNPSEQVQFAAVTQSGWAIEYIKNPSEQVQIAAVKQDGHAIQFIKNPSEQVQLAAVNRSGTAIKFIKNPSEPVQLAAVNKSGFAIRFIKNPSEQVQIAAVNRDGSAIDYIKNPSEQVQIAAVKQYVTAIRFINDPSIYMLNKCKHEIIKAILIGLKDSEFELASQLIQKAAKTNWPELAIIKRSLDHEKNRISESLI